MRTNQRKQIINVYFIFDILDINTQVLKLSFANTNPSEASSLECKKQIFTVLFLY